MLRLRLSNLGRAIDFAIYQSGLDEAAGRTLKLAANSFAKTPLMEKAPGENISDKIAYGIQPTLFEKMTGIANRYDEVNFNNKSLFLSIMTEVPGFNPEALANSSPQSDAFMADQAPRLEALEKITIGIRNIFLEVSQDEDDFLAKVDVLRDFENHDIGHYYDWQTVDDPFVSEEDADIEFDT